MKNALFVSITLVIIVLHSCSPMLYEPISDTVPTLRNEKELLIKTEFSASNPIASWFVDGDQVASRFSTTYSATKSIGLHIEGSRFLGSIDKRYNTVLGLGYLSNVVNETRERNFQVYLMAGYGAVNYNNRHGEFYSIGVQPKIGISKNAFEIYFAASCKYLDHFILEGFNLYEPTRKYLVEPSMGVVLKLDVIKIHTDIGYSMNQKPMDHIGIYIGIGMSYSILFK